jgi:lysophospholipase L1-like esterase
MTGDGRGAAKRWALRAGATGLVVALAAAGVELALRLVYPAGMSVANNTGALARRFNRDFVLNRYDGSRGPALGSPAAERELHILVQGDSVTWGAGVKREEDLFTSRLLQDLRRDGRRVQMAVLAKPGREIDGHLDELRRWGREIQPDLIIYQWAVNDLEIDKSGRPPRPGLYRLWRRLPMRERLVEHSYLAAFVDQQVRRLLPPGPPRYGDYLLARFGDDTPAWRRFEEVFQAWVAEARRLTPRILVLMHPDSYGADGVHRRFEALCRSVGVTTVAGAAAFGGGAVPPRLQASPFDDHPSAAAHALLASLLRDRMGKLWPELIGGRPPLSSPAAMDQRSGSRLAVPR